MKTLPHTRSCFVCGESNPAGLNLRFHTDGRAVQTHFTPKPEHVGFQGIVHGGILATLLDEIMVWACVVQTKRFAFCAELNVRFLQPVPPGQELTASGELTLNRRDRIFEARSELKNEKGTVLVTATGKYMPVKRDDVMSMAGDFVDDARWLLD